MQPSQGTLSTFGQGSILPFFWCQRREAGENGPMFKTQIYNLWANTFVPLDRLIFSLFFLRSRRIHKLDFFACQSSKDAPVNCWHRVYPFSVPVRARSRANCWLRQRNNAALGGGRGQLRTMRANWRLLSSHVAPFAFIFFARGSSLIPSLWSRRVSSLSLLSFVGFADYYVATRGCDDNK